nr:PAS domain-containing sensor histidine kinase [Polyangiaceae bacterium]
MSEHDGPRFVRRPARPAPVAPPAAERPERFVDVVEFHRLLAEAAPRFASLREKAEREASVDGDVERALTELDVAWEELRTADEELRVQTEELDLAAGSLESERSRYRELFDFSPDPYIVTTDQGKISAANRASAGLFNMPAHKLVGRFLISFVRLGERSAFRERLGAVLRERRTLRWDATLTPPSHRDPLLETAVAVTASPGREGGLLWALRDVGEKRRQEAKLVALNAELERRVIERTSALEASRLALEGTLKREREARQLAQQAGREREEFLAALSHELRPPLHALLDWVHLAAEKNDPETRRKALTIIDRNSRAMASLVDDLFDSVRIERGELVLTKERLGLGELVAGLCASLLPSAQARGVALAHEVEAGSSPFVEGDRQRLEQIFINLLANALKFTPPGGAVRVRVAREV